MSRSSSSASVSGGSGPLSPLIHGRVRLLVLSFLMKAPGPVSFTDLRRELGLTDGTLSVHLSKLAEGGILQLDRTFVGKRPQTRIHVTRTGRTQFRRYVQDLRAIIPGLE